MFTEGFGPVGDERADITEEEFEANLAGAPAPVRNLIRAFMSNREAVSKVADVIGESGNVHLMYVGMGLMLSCDTLDRAFEDFLDYLVERSQAARDAIESADVVA